MNIKKIGRNLAIGGLAAILLNSFIFSDYKDILPKKIYMSNEEIEISNEWKSSFKNTLRQSIYDSHSVILSKSKKEVKTSLENILKKIDKYEFENSWKDQLNEKNTLQRLLNINSIWSQVSKNSNFDYKYELHSVNEIIDYDIMLKKLNKNTIRADCVETVAFFILNYDTFTTKKELEKNNIYYSFITVPGIKIKKEQDIKTPFGFNHLCLLIHDEDNLYLIDPTKNLNSPKAKPVKYNYKLHYDEIKFDENKFDDFQIMILEPQKNNLNHYHKYKEFGIAFFINPKNTQKIMNGFSIYY